MSQVTEVHCFSPLVVRDLTEREYLFDSDGSLIGVGMTCRDSNTSFHKHEYSPEKNCMKHTWLLILRAERVQTLHCFLRIAILLRVVLGPTRTKIPHHDCATMLQTTLVFLTENIGIRRCSTIKLTWKINTVSPCFQPGLCELTGFTSRIFLKMCKKHCACQLACSCVVSWAYPRYQDRLILLQSSPSNHQVFFVLAQPQVDPPRHCANRGGFARDAFFKWFKPFCDPSPGARAPGIRNRWPDAWTGYEVLSTLPQVAHGSQTCT